MKLAKHKFLIAMGMLLLPVVTFLAFVQTPHVSGVVLKVALKVARFRTGLQVSARAWEVSPFGFAASLEELEIVSPKGRLVAPHVRVRVSPVALLVGRLHLSRVEIDAPVVVLHDRFDALEKKSESGPEWQALIKSNPPRRMGELTAVFMEKLRERHLGFDELVIRDLRLRMHPLSISQASLTVSNLQEGQLRLEWDLRGARVLRQIEKIESFSGSLSLLRSGRGNFSLVLGDLRFDIDSKTSALEATLRGGWPGEFVLESEASLAALRQWWRQSPALGADPWTSGAAGTLIAKLRIVMEQRSIQDTRIQLESQQLNWDGYQINDVTAAVVLEKVMSGSPVWSIQKLQVGLPRVLGDRKEWLHRLRAEHIVLKDNQLEAELLLEEAGLCGVLRAASVEDCQVGVGVSGLLKISGTLDPLRLEIRPDLQTTEGPVRSDPFGDPDGTTVVVVKPAALKGGVALAKNEILDLQGLVLSWKDGSKIDVNGEIVYTPTLVDLKFKTSKLMAEGVSADLVGVDLLGELSAEGSVYYNVSLPGPQRTRVDVDLRAAQIGMEGQKFGALAGPVQYRNSILEFGPFLLRNGGGNATLNGTLRPSQDKGSFLDVLVRTNRLEVVAMSENGDSEFFGGFVTGRSRIRGYLDEERNPGGGLKGEVEASLKNFRAFDIPFQSAELKAVYSQKQLEITEFQALKDKKAVRMKGLLSSKGGSGLTFESDPLPIRNIEVDPKLQIFSRGTVSIEGFWKPEKGWEVEGKIRDAEVAGRKLGNGSVLVGGDSRELRLDLKLGDRVDVTYRGDTSGPTTHIRILEAKLEDLGIYGGLAYLSAWTQLRPIETKGQLAFRWEPTHGYFRTQDLILRAPEGSAGLMSTLLQVPGTQELKWKDRSVVANNLRWKGESRAEIKGAVGDQRLQVKGKLPLALMQLFVSGLGMKGGYLNMNAEIPLSPNFATLSATATMTEGIVEVPGISQPFTNARAQLQMSRNQLNIREGILEAGGGSVTIEGAYKLDFDNPGVSLNARLDRAKTILLDDVPVDLSGSLQLRGEKVPYLLEGRVTAVNSLYSKEFGDVETLHVENVPEPTLRFNIDVEVASTSQVRNALVNSGVSGRLVLQGNDVVPAVRGELDLSAGGIIMANQTEFRIVHGRVVLQDDAEAPPLVNLRANTVVRYTNQDYRIELNARGPATSLSLDLTSDPALRQEDIVSLLAFGVIRSDETEATSGTDQQIASAAQAEAFQALFGKTIGSNINRTTGFDVRLQASTAASRSESTLPKVTVMRRLGERVTARFGRSLDLSSPEKDFQVDYRLLNNVNLTGVWESPTPEESSLGVDLRFRFDVK